MHMCYKIFKPLGYGVLLAKTTFRTKIGGGWAWGASKNLGPPYVFLQLLKLATSNLVHKLGLVLAYQKTTFRPKICGGLGERGIQISWDPYLFLQPLKLATSNFVHNLGLGLAYQKQRLGPKLAGVWARGASEKKLGPPTYFFNL